MNAGVIMRRVGTRRWGAGFTAIELIGFLSIVSLLTLLVVESVRKRARQAQRTGEAGTVRAMADAFKGAIIRTRSFPVVTNALPLIGGELAVLASQVLINPQGRTRAIVYDPNLNFGGGSVANQFGANQQAIVDEMYFYMWAYAQWASEGFPKGGSSSSQHVPELRFISDSSVRLSQVAGNLLKK